MMPLPAQTIWKGLRLLVVLALALSAAGPGGRQLAWAQSEPTLQVDRYGNLAEGFAWPAGVETTLTVDDPETPSLEDFSATATVDEWGHVWFNLSGVDLHPGVVVALSDSATTKEVILGPLEVVFPQPGQSLVNGVADPNSQVEVEYWEGMVYTVRRVISGSDGAWQVDFSVPGGGPDEQDLVAELQPGGGGRVCQADVEGDQDCHWLEVLSPRITARPWINVVLVQNWPSGATLTMSLDDPLTGASPDYAATQTAEPDNQDRHYTKNAFFLPQPLNLDAGMKITVSDDETIKAHTVSELTFTNMDVNTDTIGGSAVPESEILVYVQDDHGEATRNVIAGPGGDWQADFRQQANPDEGTLDLRPDTWVWVEQYDEDYDRTEFNLPSNSGAYAPQRIKVDTTRNFVIAEHWPLGVNLTLNVDDPDTPEQPDYTATQIAQPQDIDPQFDLGYGFTLRPGMLVTLADGIISRSLVVHDLGISGVNTVTDTVSGIAVPSSGVWVAANLGDMDWLRFTTAGSDGKWMVDYSQPGPYPDMQQPIDLVAEMNIRAIQYDEDGDTTRPSWRPPTINVDISNDTVAGNRWLTGATVTLTVEDLETPQSPDLQIPQTVHQLWPQRVLFNLSGLFDLRPGQKITLSDGANSRSLTIDNLAVTQVDTAADRLAGIAPPEAEICLYRWDDESYELCVLAEANGDWTADLGYDLQPGDTGEAWTYGTSSGVWVTWYAGWSPPDPETLVFASSIPFDLDVTGNEDGENHFVRMQLLEPLLRPGLEGGLELAAASDYSLSADGLVYTFNLRPDAYWSDGVQLTAQHFVDGILRMLDPDLGTGYGPQLFPIENAQDYYDGVIGDASLVGVRALPDGALQITLAQPAAHFLQVLATPLVLPVRQDLIDLYGDEWQAAGNFQGNGPYQLVERDSAHLLLEPNPNYHSLLQVTFPSVAFSYIPVITEQLEAYRDGEVDVVLNVAGQYPLIKSDPALLADLFTAANSIVTYLGLGVQNAPLDNPLVRQALAYATNRQELLNELRPANQLALGVIPPDIEGYQGSEVGLLYSPTLAQEFLTDAGYPGGVGFPEIELLANTQVFPLIERIAVQWRETLNIPVRVTTYRNRNPYLNACRADPARCGPYVYFLGWAADYADGYSYLNDVFHPDSGPNWTGWDNPRYRELMVLILAESNPAQRLTYMNEAEHLLVEDEAAVIPLYFQDQAILARPGIYPHLELAFSDGYLTRWGDSDLDGDGLPDLIDACPADPDDACDPAGSEAGVYGAEGGALATEDGGAALDVPAGALDERITFTMVDASDGYQLDTDLGEAQVVASYDIGPSGTTFLTPATVTLHWTDADNDGAVDGTDLLENELYVFKDGVAISQVCSLDPGCDVAANSFSVQVSSLSHFALGALVAAAPVIDFIHAPIDPLPIGAMVEVSAEVRNLSNDATLTWEWGDGTSTTGAALSASHVYSQADLYRLRLTVNQSGFAPVGAVYEYIVIYDPTGGFVTGGGWIETDAGKANFGFNAKYKKNSTLPEGETEFQLKEADLRLHSTAYDWLVVSSANSWAMYKGVGLINEQLAPNGTAYKFMVWVTDGKPDAFRIRIWWVEDNGDIQVIYDTEVQAPLGGGSIVVHR